MAKTKTAWLAKIIAPINPPVSEVFSHKDLKKKNHKVYQRIQGFKEDINTLLNSKKITINSWVLSKKIHTAEWNKNIWELKLNKEIWTLMRTQAEMKIQLKNSICQLENSGKVLQVVPVE